MIYQILIILSLVGIFVVLMRRLPASTSQNVSFNLSNFKFRLPKIALRIPNLPKIKLTFPKLNMPKVGMPALSIRKLERPVIHDEDPLSQADLAFVNKDFDLAEKLYIEAVRRHPKDARIYARLGVIYMHQKNYKDARDALLTSLRFDNKVASRHYNLALVYQALGNNQKALVEVKQALSFEPANEKYEMLRQKLEQ